MRALSTPVPRRFLLGPSTPAAWRSGRRESCPCGPRLFPARLSRSSQKITTLITKRTTPYGVGANKSPHSRGKGTDARDFPIPLAIADLYLSLDASVHHLPPVDETRQDPQDRAHRETREEPTEHRTGATRRADPARARLLLGGGLRLEVPWFSQKPTTMRRFRGARRNQWHVEWRSNRALGRWLRGNGSGT